MEVYISCDRYSNNKLKKLQGQTRPVRSYILFRSHMSHLCLLLRALVGASASSCHQQRFVTADPDIGMGLLWVELSMLLILH